MKIYRLLTAIFLMMPSLLYAQDAVSPVDTVKKPEPVHRQDITVDYNTPATYVVGGLEISGLKYLSKNQINAVLGISAGDRITVPGEDVAAALKRIWLQGAASDIGFFIDSIVPTC